MADGRHGRGHRARAGAGVILMHRSQGGAHSRAHGALLKFSPAYGEPQTPGSEARHQPQQPQPAFPAQIAEMLHPFTPLLLAFFSVLFSGRLRAKAFVVRVSEAAMWMWHARAKHQIATWVVS
jgi:hypothetical protein